MGAPRADLQFLRGVAFDLSSAPALVLDEHGALATANEAAEMLFGQSLGALRRNAADALGPAVAELVAAAGERGGAVGRDLEIRVGGAAICRADVTATDLRNDMALLTLTPRDSQGRAQAWGASSLGDLGRALAHEIKNPLAGIRGAAQLLKDGARTEDAALADLIVEETERIRRLADRVEALAEEAPAHSHPVNIHRVLKRVGVLAASAMADEVRVRHDYDPSLPDALGDEDQLIQLFLNLVKNAGEAARSRGDGRGEVVISTAYRHQPRARPFETPDRAATPLEIRIRDNGPGIAPEIRDRLFQPFVSTRVGGAGLGLALTARLVAVHGGVIDFDSEPGRTVFRVMLPVAAPVEERAS